MIFSHAGPLAGFYDGLELGSQISDEQSIGGVAVAGFFFFSGFLITRSRMGGSTIFRYLWRRSMRILPAFWAALLATAFLIAPIAWVLETGSIDGYWDARAESPFTYVSSNAWLDLGQRNIAEGGSTLPYAELRGGYDWNGSAWTLRYEFLAYLIVGVLGLVGAQAHRWLGSVCAIVVMALNALKWSGIADLGTWFPPLADPFLLMLLAPFAFGMLFAIWQDVIPIDGRLAIAALALAVAAYVLGGWNAWGVHAFAYVLMWFAVRVTWLRHWDRPGDLSYGVYIFAWPLMQLGAAAGLHTLGWFVYHLVIGVAVHVCAFASWHLVEQPAMSLKRWTPRWLQHVLDRSRQRRLALVAGSAAGPGRKDGDASTREAAGERPSSLRLLPVTLLFLLVAIAVVVGIVWSLVHPGELPVPAAGAAVEPRAARG